MDYPGKVITKTQVTPTQISASGNWTVDDAVAAVKNNNWPVALVPNPISKSLRFNSADSANLTRTPTVSGSQRIYTHSAWFKRTGLSSAGFNVLWASESSGTNYVGFVYYQDKFYWNFYNGTTSYVVETTQVFRDVSAWAHIVVAVDTTQATASNRVRIYYNGVQITVFNTSNYPPQNQDLPINTSSFVHKIGFSLGFSQYLNGYLTETNYIDGYPTVGGTTYNATTWAALNVSELFGMTNPQTGQWIPKKYTGTYGTNGFYLNFKDATSTTTLGYDYSGNANNWTANNFVVSPVTSAGNDSVTDVPTPWFVYNTGDVGGIFRGNYPTLNPLKRFTANATLSNGNLTASDGSTTSTSAIATMNLPASGKWYWEVSVSASVAGGIFIGACPEANAYGTAVVQTNGSYRNNGTIYNTASATQTSGATYTTGDVIGVAVNVDSGTVQFYKNGAAQGATPSFSFTALSVLVPFIATDNAAGTKTVECNFGQRQFTHTPPAGFRSLCTTNLPPPTIGFGLTNQADDYFNAVLYTGNGSTQSITSVGFQPDWTWIKIRNAAGSHALADAVRGSTIQLASNNTDAEITRADTITSFASNGFNLGANTTGYSVNINSQSYVAWNWKAAQTLSKTYAVTVVSSGGNKYRFDGFAANAVTLELSEGGTFRFDQSDASNSGHPFRFSTTSDGTHGGGVAYTTGVTVVGTPGTSGAYTEITVAASAPTLYYYCTVHSGMGGQANTPTTNSFSNLTGTIQSNISPNTTAGFSIVTYTGTGTNGATVGHGLGVTPSMMIFKRRNSTGQWATYHTSIGNTGALRLNATSATITDVSFWNNTSPTSTVFTIGVDGDVNTNTGTYVAYCFAAVPGYSAFGSYTGNGSADGPFVYLGFRPRFILTKSSSGAFYWVIEDAARNPSNVVDLELFPNDSLAETNASRPIDFLSNGFKIRHTGNTQNASGGTYIYAAFAESPFQFSNAR